MNTQQVNVESNGSKSSQPKTLQGIDFMEGAVNRPLRVYLVEDSPHVRDLLLDFLHIPGEVEIVGFSDTEAESIAALISDPVDAVIVDLKLREGSGMGVIEKLRKANLSPQPKIIVFTNHPFPEIKKRAINLGADYFFDKSAEYESVRTTLQGLRTI